jgi:hypothetical protein
MKYLVLLLLFPLPALADLVNVTWVNPTTYTNGAPLAASAITRTRVEYGTNTVLLGCTFGVRIADAIAIGSATNVTTPDLPIGNYAFRAYTTANGVESAPSSPACKQISQSAPSAPTGVTVTVTINIAP